LPTESRRPETPTPGICGWRWHSLSDSSAMGRFKSPAVFPSGPDDGPPKLYSHCFGPARPPIEATGQSEGAVLPRWLYPSGSTINSASSHFLGVKNDSSPRFGKLPIERDVPVLGSIQNALRLPLALTLFMSMEKEALLPRYAMIHSPSLCRAARFSTCPLVFPPLVNMAWSGTRFHHSLRSKKILLRMPI